MRGLILGLLSGLCAACTTAAPQPSSQRAPADAARADTALLSACQTACEARSQARAVAAEMIVRECAERCGVEQGWPRVNSGVSARRLLGRQVRLTGTYTGDRIELSDGVQVNLRFVNSHEFEPGRTVTVAGTLDSEAELGFVLEVRYGVHRG